MRSTAAVLFHPFLSPRPYSLSDSRAFSRRAAGGRHKLRRGKGERSGAESAVTSGGAEGRPGAVVPCRLLPARQGPVGSRSGGGRGAAGASLSRAALGPLRAAAGTGSGQGAGRRDGPGRGRAGRARRLPHGSSSKPPGAGTAARPCTAQLWRVGAVRVRRGSDCPVKSVGCWHNSRAFGRARRLAASSARSPTRTPREEKR